MRSTPSSLRWIIVILVLLLALTACERPIPRDEGTDTTDVVEPTPEPPIVIPTPIPTEAPTSEAPTAPDTGAPADTGTDTQPVEQPTEEPAGDTTDDTTVPETPTTEATTYTVQAGDTLGQIAERFEATLEEIAAANGITDLDALEIGQVLTIPAAGTVETTPPQGEERTHVVKSGENLFRIGLAYGFTAEELAEYNGITNVNRIEVGQVIRIPPEN